MLKNHLTCPILHGILLKIQMLVLTSRDLGSLGGSWKYLYLMGLSGISDRDKLVAHF